MRETQCICENIIFKVFRQLRFIHHDLNSKLMLNGVTNHSLSSTKSDTESTGKLDDTEGHSK